MNRHSTGRIIPGFGISLGLTTSFVSMMVLIPMLFLAVQSADSGWSGFRQALSDPRILAGYKVSFLCSFTAAGINCVFGLILAWVLTRYTFPGRRLIDGLIELPFALPTAVAGIALTALYADKGWIGRVFALLDIRIAYTKAGIIIAMTFITLPFIVRTIQPVLERLDGAYEEAGRMLGASRERIFRKIILPELAPAILTGFGLAFARALGEYGSVVFIAGNMPFRTEIAPLLIMSKLEQFNYDESAAIALVMLVVSFTVMFGINCVQSKAASYSKG